MQRCQEVKEKLEVWGPRATSTVRGQKHIRLIGKMVLVVVTSLELRVDCFGFRRGKRKTGACWVAAAANVIFTDMIAMTDILTRVMSGGEDADDANNPEDVETTNDCYCC